MKHIVLFILMVTFFALSTCTVRASYVYAPATPIPSEDVLRVRQATFKGFDTGGAGGVWHTFTDLPSVITGATLEFRAIGDESHGNRGVDNDEIILLFTDAQSQSQDDALRWLRHFGLLDGVPGLLLADATWSHGSDKTLTLDLSALPMADGSSLNLLPEMAVKGFLDVGIGDDTLVDYYVLTIVPEPSTLVLLGLAGLALRTRKPEHVPKISSTSMQDYSR